MERSGIREECTLKTEDPVFRFAPYGLRGEVLEWGRGARVVEEARLEIVCALITYRGFESLPLRQ